MYISLVTYIGTNLNASGINVKITSSIWKGLFVKIQSMESARDIIIGNIYHPRYDNSCKENVSFYVWAGLNFIQLWHNELIVTGDININLLPENMCNKEHYGDFLDVLLGHSLFSKIALPT